MANQKFLNPFEWRKLESKKKLNMLTRLFFVKCSETPMFINKKISSDYCKVRTFFRKQEELVINLLYDYIWSIERKPMSMTDLFQNANKWNQEQHMNNNSSQSIQVKQYEDLLEVFKKL